MAKKTTAVFYYQSFLSDPNFAKALAEGGPRLKFDRPSPKIAEWEDKMKTEVGLNAKITGVVGTLSTSGCIGNGSDDCDTWQ